MTGWGGPRQWIMWWIYLEADLGWDEASEGAAGEFPRFETPFKALNRAEFSTSQQMDYPENFSKPIDRLSSEEPQLRLQRAERNHLHSHINLNAARMSSHCCLFAFGKSCSETPILPVPALIHRLNEMFLLAKRIAFKSKCGNNIAFDQKKGRKKPSLCFFPRNSKCSPWVCLWWIQMNCFLLVVFPFILAGVHLRAFWKRERKNTRTKYDIHCFSKRNNIKASLTGRYDSEAMTIHSRTGNEGMHKIWAGLLPCWRTFSYDYY